MSSATVPIEQEIPAQPLPVSHMAKHSENTVTISHKPTGHSAETAWHIKYCCKAFFLQKLGQRTNAPVSTNVSLINIWVNNYSNIRQQLLVCIFLIIQNTVKLLDLCCFVICLWQCLVCSVPALHLLAVLANKHNLTKTKNIKSFLFSLYIFLDFSWHIVLLKRLRFNPVTIIPISY